MEVEIKKLSISEINQNPNNPRLIRDVRYKKLVQSLKDFPEMLQLREIVIDENNIILGGNMRFKALKEIGEKFVYAKIVTGLSEKQKAEFIIKDNIEIGENDWDKLQDEWSDFDLDEWGLEMPETQNNSNKKDSIKLADKFLFPPFSVLNARCGEWQDRKRQWLSLGIKSELGRGENCLGLSATMVGITDEGERSQENEILTQIQT